MRPISSWRARCRADLTGTYYRNGPDPLHPPRKGDTYHWFDGDGMIQCFNIEGGRVSWRNRWVKSEKFKRELAAGERLFGVFGNPMMSDPSVVGAEYNTANTHIVEHAGRLLALMEGALPTQMRQHSLETIGTHDFDGAIAGPVTAHPKFDVDTGEMIFFGYSAQGPASRTLRYNVADRNGRVIRNEFFEAPFAAMVHDFFVTDTHAIFPIFPLTMSIERVMTGGPMLAWEPDKGTHFGVIPRDGTAADVKWYTMESRFMFHMMNAWTDGTKLHADVTGANATQFAPKLDGSMAKPSDGIAPTFRRWSIDLADNSGDHQGGTARRHRLRISAHRRSSHDETVSARICGWHDRAGDGELQPHHPLRQTHRRPPDVHARRRLHAR